MAPGLLVIGASQWKYAYEYLDNCRGFDVAIISRPGMRVDEVEDSMLQACEFFDYIVIHLGTNNIICGETPAKVAQHYATLISKIKERNPDAYIYASSVIYRGLNGFKLETEWERQRIYKMNKKIRDLNGMLEELCLRMNINFIDNWRAFEAADADPYRFLLSRDGLHLCSRGIKCLIGNVYRHCFSDLPAFSSSPEAKFSIPLSHSSTNLPASSGCPRTTTCIPVLPSSNLSYRDALLLNLNFSTSTSTTQTVLLQPSSLKPPASSQQPIDSVEEFQCTHSWSLVKCKKGKRSVSSNTSQIPLSNRWSVLSSLTESSLSASTAKLEKHISSLLSGKPKTSRRGKQKDLPFQNLSPSKKKSSLSFILPSSVKQKDLSLPSSSLKQGSKVPLFPPRISSKKIYVSQDIPQNESPRTNHYVKMPFSQKTLSPQTSSSMQDLSDTNGHTLHNSSLSSSFKPVTCSSIITYPSHCQIKRNDIQELSNCCPPSDLISPNNYLNNTNGGSPRVGAHVSHYPKKCDKCNREYANRSSFYHHKLKCGEIGLGEAATYPRVCPKCNVSYANRSSFSRHQKHCENAFRYVICPHKDCSVKMQSQKLLISHLKNSHLEEIAVENYSFKNMTEFNVWKKNECQLHDMSLVKHSGEHVNGHSKYHYFICKFDNHHKNELTINKTSRKRKFGRMPNSNCMARMLVKENNSGVSVEYINSHNHDNDFKNVKFFRWENQTKYQINSLLEKAVPAHKIQESFQPSDPDFSEVSPIKEHFITSSQINKMKYELASKQHLSKDDAVAVDLLVHSMQDESKDSILIYKPLGNPTEIGDKGLDVLSHASEIFALGIQVKQQAIEMVSGCSRILCIDSTHGTNHYKFHLLNLIVPDEYGVGYPIAHFIISHLDEETLTLILCTITNRYPDLLVNAVMTDGDEALGNAVKKAFGKDTRHLLCHWHVKRNWQKNLLQKVKNSESLVSEIYQSLDTIIGERNEEKFNIMMESFVGKYSESAPAFINYFREYYSSKKEKWAMCYRNFPHAKTDTNMFVESYHNTLKSHYLNRKANRRLDDLIQFIVAIHKTIHLRLTHKRLMGEPPLGFCGSHASDHGKGMKILDSDIEQSENDNTWKVRSQSDPSVTFCVTNISQKCPYPHLCFIKCNELSCLELCCHMYHCSCPNRFALCKHVHKVHSLTIRNIPCTVLSINEAPKALFKNGSTTKLIGKEPSPDQLIHSISVVLDKLKSLSKQCTPALLPHVLNSLKLLADKCEGNIEEGISVESRELLKGQYIPPNSKIRKQLKLHQTMKKRQTPVIRFKKPDAVRKIAIREDLLPFKDEVSFSEPFEVDTNPLLLACQVGHLSVKFYDLKSLDYHIPEEEVENIRAVVKDFQRGWLYDTIIAAFLWRLTESDSSVDFVDPVISQFITRKVTSHKEIGVFKNLDSASVSKIFIPFNITNSHWMLIVALPHEKKVYFLDPASSCTSVEASCHNAIQCWIGVLALKYGGEKGDWKMLVPSHALQKDCHNCGVFVAWYCERLLTGESLSTCFNPNEYRKYMHDVITGVVAV